MSAGGAEGSGGQRWGCWGREARGRGAGEGVVVGGMGGVGVRGMGLFGRVGEGEEGGRWG